MAFADPVRVNAQVYEVLGRPSQQQLPLNDVQSARVDASMQVLRAIANAGPSNGHYSSLVVPITLINDQYLPSHDGLPGIPIITPFAGGNPREGTPATPQEIDSYRLDTTNGLYSATGDGEAVPHNLADDTNSPSPIACRFSLDGGKLKFTGHTATVPLVQLTRAMAESQVPENYEPTLVRLMPFKLVRAKSEYYAKAQDLLKEGQRDLREIAAGAMRVPPVE